MSEIEYLVCALADAPRMVPGSIFTHYCSTCRRRVMIAPSGQKLLKDNPARVVICGHCASHADWTISADLDIETILREVESAQPNFWRKRN